MRSIPDATAIILTDLERAELEALARSTKTEHRMRLKAQIMELCGIFGDGVNQAADFFSDATSIPSRNVTPLTTFGN